tara:strand:- start:254 stop:430 length:177 start_codon:yes stop_codon:yes gene_type:complete
VKKFKYNGKRVSAKGIIRSFDNKVLTPEKLERLNRKGWEEVIEKPKPKPKAQPKKQVK